MDYTIEYVLSRAILVILSVSCLVVLYDWRNQFSVIRYFSFFIFLNLITEIVAKIFQYYGENNLPLLHLYTFGEFVLISLFYFYLFKRKNIARRFLLLLIPVVSILIILNSIYLQSIFGFNSYAKTMVQLIIISYSLYYFFKQPANILEEQINNRPLLLINTAILIYYSGSLFVFMFSDFLYKYGEGLPKGFWMFNIILNLIFQLLILVALWMVLKNKKYIS